MRILLLFITLFSLYHIGNSQALTVEVYDIGTLKGNLFCAVFDSEKTFRDPDAAVVRRAVPITNKTQRVTFPDLPPGTYAIGIFQDLDGSESISTNFFGYPTEGFGFSNDAMGLFGPPSFEECAFTHITDTKVRIRMRN